MITMKIVINVKFVAMKMFVPVIQRNEYDQEGNEDVSANVTSEDEDYGDLEEDNYETIADENIYESLEEFDEFEEDYR